MNKKLIFSIFLTSFMFACGKEDQCLSCNYNLNGQIVELTGDNLCGSDSALDAVEQAFINDAMAAGANAEDITCSRE